VLALCGQRQHDKFFTAASPRRRVQSAHLATDGSSSGSWSGDLVDVTPTTSAPQTCMQATTGDVAPANGVFKAGGTCPDCSGGIYVPAGLSAHVPGSFCYANVSTNASCVDALQNGDETGVDCGGSCAACVVETTISATFSATGAVSAATFSGAVHAMLGGQAFVAVTSYEMELQSTLNLPAGSSLSADDWTNLNNQLAVQFNVSAGNVVAAAGRRRLRTLARRGLQAVSNASVPATRPVPPWNGVVSYTVAAAKDITGTLPTSLALRFGVAGALGMDWIAITATDPAAAIVTTTLAYIVTMNETMGSGRSTAAVSSLSNSTAVTVALLNAGVTVTNVVTAAVLGNAEGTPGPAPVVDDGGDDDDDTTLYIGIAVVGGVVLIIISIVVFKITSGGKAQENNSSAAKARRGGNVFEVAQEFTANPLGVDSHLPAGWIMKVDQRSGREYYCNTVARETTWTMPTRPAAAAPVANSTAAGQWRAKQDPQGNTYYINPTTRQSKWQLPPGAVLVGGTTPSRRY
jgi:hypothetical protein